MKKPKVYERMYELVDLVYTGDDSQSRQKLQRMCLMAFWAGYQTAINDGQEQANRARTWFKKTEELLKKCEKIK